ncbi:unnamed protein product [Caenorhabditis nigoni]
MLTQLSSICVLEYSSFEKRLYIVSQIPGLRKIEKSLPLRLDHLNIANDRLRIDEYEYYLINRIELRKSRIQNPSIEDTVSRLKFPPYKNTHALFENLVFHIFGNRPTIYTKKLEVWDFGICRLTGNLKVRAETIETDRFYFDHTDLDRISEILEPNPLGEFSARLWDLRPLTHPIVQSSQKLVLWRGSVRFDHRAVHHRNIHLKDYDRQTFIDHMNAWIANGPEIGMEFAGDIQVFKNSTLNEILIKEMMYWKKIERDGRRVKPDERFPNTLYSISLPQINDPDTEIQMSLLKNASNPELPFQIHVKIQSAGTAIPERFDSMCLESKLWGTRKRIERLYRNSSNRLPNLPNLPPSVRNFLANQYFHLKGVTWGIVLKLILVALVSGILGFFLISWILAVFCGQKCAPFL